MNSDRAGNHFFPWSGPINLQSYLDEENIAPTDVRSVAWMTERDGKQRVTVYLRDGNSIVLVPAATRSWRHTDTTP